MGEDESMCEVKQKGQADKEGRREAWIMLINELLTKSGAQKG